MNLPGASSVQGRRSGGTVVNTSNGANSFYGGGGATGTVNGSEGSPGTGYGSGGAGALVIDAATNYAGGDGTQGLIVVEEFY